jgi:hypothetical protein
VQAVPPKPHYTEAAAQVCTRLDVLFDAVEDGVVETVSASVPLLAVLGLLLVSLRPGFGSLYLVALVVVEGCLLRGR